MYPFFCDRAGRREYWWQHSEVAIGLRNAVRNISRYIATPRVSKHRVFNRIDAQTIPDDGVYALARDDDYFFGVLHSKVHELWARATGTPLRETESGFRHTPTSTFQTFPFPWAPGAEPKDDPRVQAIAQAAKELVEQRDRWLNPGKTSEVSPADSQVVKTPEKTSEVSRKPKRTLTNLYNQRPTWLDLAHKRLDEAVFTAYGWKPDLTNEEILEKLLTLNLEKSQSK